MQEQGTNSTAKFLSVREIFFVLVPVLVLMVLSQLALALFFSGLSRSEFADVFPVIALLALPGLILVLLIPLLKKNSVSAVPLVLVLVAGAVMRLSHFCSDPILETDHYRYLWDGALTARGINPYTLSPLAVSSGGAGGSLAELARSGHDVLSRVNFPELRSIYPGTAQLTFGLAHLIAPWKVNGLRTVLFFAELSTFFLLLVWLRQLGRSPLLVSLYWVNPLIVLCFANQVHIDALIPPLLLGALWLLQNDKKHMLAGSLLGAAVGVKLWPVLILPLCAAFAWSEKARLTRLLFGFISISVATTAPLLVSSAHEGSGLVAYGIQWANNNAFYTWLKSLLEWLGLSSAATELFLRALLAVTIVFITTVIALRVHRSATRLITAVLIVTATLFYLSPAQFPWYAIWFLPFAVLRVNPPLLLATATLPSYFLFFPLSLRGETSFFMHYVSLIHALPVLLWLLLRLRKDRA